jgi:hypothetical protein
VNDVDDAVNERPDRDHERKGGDGFEGSLEDEHAEGEGEQPADDESPLGAMIGRDECVCQHWCLPAASRRE